MPPALDAPCRLASVVARVPVHGGGADQAREGHNAEQRQCRGRRCSEQPQDEGLRGVREDGKQEGEGATTTGWTRTTVTSTAEGISMIVMVPSAPGATLGAGGSGAQYGVDLLNPLQVECLMFLPLQLEMP